MKAPQFALSLWRHAPLLPALRGLLDTLLGPASSRSSAALGALLAVDGRGVLHHHGVIYWLVAVGTFHATFFRRTWRWRFRAARRTHTWSTSSLVNPRSQSSPASPSIERHTMQNEVGSFMHSRATARFEQ